MMASAGTSLYFVSDIHLGAPDAASSLQRERALIQWLDTVSTDAKAIYIIGDLFDFWFEYKHVIPKGFVRLQAKIAQLTDAGIDIHFFKGNHDMWAFQYFQEELGVQLHAHEHVFDAEGKRFFVHHGDGLGPGDYKYKFLKAFFRSRLCIWLFARLHPNFGIGLARFFSGSSRKSGTAKDRIYKGKENEWLYVFAQELEAKHHHDYYIFGHRHLPLDLSLKNARYVNTGEWLSAFTFARFRQQELELLHWNAGQILPFDGTRSH
ncbi:MAG: hypothetical protein RLZZ301_299 [Bacteroidota bacterium]|jgi:UDP-2,3-diacylglucosamine hydrolase